MSKHLNATASPFKPTFIVSALAAAILAPSISYAAVALEEVVVTARKQDESIQNIPVAVSSFSQTDLKDLNVSLTSDLGAFTPSLYIQSPGASSGTIASVTVRGQVQIDYLITLDPSVGWYLDDVYLARPENTNSSMFDIERVEVLKGPQGTLYGRNTTGGTIKLVTTKADPSEGLTGFVTGGLGNYDQSKIGGAINIPIIKDVLAIRLSAQQDKVDEGFQKVTLYDGNPTHPTFGTPIGNRKNGTQDNKVYRLGVTYQPNDALRAFLTYEENETDVSMAFANTAPPGLLAFSPLYVAPSSDFMKVALNEPNTSYAKSKTASATVEYDITADLSTKLVYGWRNVDAHFQTDIDGTSLPLFSMPFPFETSAEQNSLEWQLTGTAMDGGLDWLTGLYYFEESGQDFSRAGDSSGFANGVYYDIAKTDVDKNRSRSAFFQGTLHLTDALNFTGGVRYTRDTKPIQQTAIVVPFSPLAPSTCRFAPGSGIANENDANCTWGDKASYEYISWTVGFDYHFTPDVMGYLKASSADRAGGQNARGLDAATTQPFQPEKATDIELGTKGSFLNHTVQVNADYYHTFYTDIQQTDLLITSSGLTTAVSNRGHADINGIEVEARWQATDALQLGATLGWLDWKFKDDTSILPQAPGLQYTARGDYTVPLGFGDLLFDVNYSWRDEVLGNCAGGRDCVRNFKQETGDSVGLLGARIALDIKSIGLNVALWGRNLTDEQYVTPGLQLYFPPVLALSDDIIGAPRTFGLEATYKF